MSSPWVTCTSSFVNDVMLFSKSEPGLPKNQASLCETDRSKLSVISVKKGTIMYIILGWQKFFGIM